MGAISADHITGARYVELPGADHLFFAGDGECEVLGERRVEGRGSTV
jgi:hypothetical protein